MTALAISVANYIIKLANESNTPITPMKLLKLTYISHGWSLGLFGTPLFKDEIQAWRYGPVIPTVYAAYKDYRNKPIPSPITPPSIVLAGYVAVPELDAKQKELVGAVWDAYKHRSAIELSTLTHKADTPWFTVWENRGGKNTQCSKIEDLLIEAHYEKLITDRESSDSSQAH